MNRVAEGPLAALGGAKLQCTSFGLDASSPLLKTSGVTDDGLPFDFIFAIQQALFLAAPFYPLVPLKTVIGSCRKEKTEEKQAKGSQYMGRNAV